MPTQSPVRYSLPPAERPVGARGAAALRAAAQADIRLVRRRDRGGVDPSRRRLAGPRRSARPACLVGCRHGVCGVHRDHARGSRRHPGDVPSARAAADGYRPAAFRRVGTHRRIRLADALALRAREKPVRKALEALAADTEDLERTYGI